MPELRAWQELPAGGVVDRDTAERPRTGSWRTGLVPRVDLARCVNCLLCWVYCPDSAVTIAGATFTGFDEDVCKGCEICATICPTGAIEMAEEAADGR